MITTNTKEFFFIHFTQVWFHGECVKTFLNRKNALDFIEVLSAPKQRLIKYYAN